MEFSQVKEFYSIASYIASVLNQKDIDVNVDNMYMVDQFNDWLAEQKELKNFPNFGDKCSEYDIIILQNMANLAYISDDGLAKYMLGARIDYKEE